MTPLRFAVVGCGAVSLAYHLPVLARARDAHLVAVVDRDRAWVREVARRFRVPHAATDVEALETPLDAAVIATPGASHARVASPLLRAGVHVLCEKPLATTPDDARALAALARDAGGAGRLMAAHVRRFQENLRMASTLVRRGVIGAPRRLAIAHGVAPGGWPSRTAYREDRRQAGGGVLMELGVHLVDLALWLLGDAVAAVDATLDTDAATGLEHEARLAVRMRGGAVAHLHASALRGLDRTVRIEGDAGWVATSLDESDRVTCHGPGLRACRLDGAQDVLVPVRDPFERQLAEFCRCIRDRRPFPVPAADVLRGLDLIAGVYREAGACPEVA